MAMQIGKDFCRDDPVFRVQKTLAGYLTSFLDNFLE